MNNLAEVDGLSRDSPADGLGFRVQGVGCRGFTVQGLGDLAFVLQVKQGPVPQQRSELSHPCNCKFRDLELKLVVCFPYYGHLASGFSYQAPERRAASACRCQRSS